MYKFIKNIALSVFALAIFILPYTTSAGMTPSLLSWTATNVTSTTVKLNGTVNPNGTNANAWFEMQAGTRLGYQNIGSGNSGVTMTPYNVSGLTPGTNYQFRLVSQNQVGTTYSSWKSFTTTSSNTSGGSSSCGCCGCDTPSVNITASPTSVSYGGSSNISWTSNNTTSCTATGGSSGWSGARLTNGSFFASSLTNTTTYNISCVGTNGQYVSDQVTVTVASQPTPAPTVNISANPSSVAYGGSSTISWTSSNATSCTASGTGWSGTKATSGNYYASSLTSTKTYTITCTGPGGQATDTTTVYVQSAPQAPTVSLSASPNSVAYGGSTNLTWNVSNATSCTANSNPLTSFTGSKSASGGSQYVGNLTQTTYFNITCTGPGGQASDTTYVTVQSAPQAPTVNISANPSSVAYGGSSTISWTSSNATSCTASGGSYGWSGTKQLNGSASSGTLYSTTTFTITCYGNGGQASDSTTVYTNQQQNPPEVSLSANSTNLAYNGSTTIYWYPQDATSCYASGGSNGWSGTKSTYNGTFYTGNLTANTTYNITCTNSDGTDTDTLTVYVNNAPTINPNVTTYSATNVSTNYATLNGYVTPNTNPSVYAWFEWGTNSYYGNQTNRTFYGSSNTNYNYSLGGLQPNTTYYYRAVAQATNGSLVYGAQKTFRTSTNVCTTCDRPNVTTYSATNVSTNYATLNGYVNPNGSSANRWFQWSTSSSFLSNNTNKVYQGLTGRNINHYLTGLQPNTTYYFRAVAQNSNGIAYGNVLSFRTKEAINQCSYGTCSPNTITTFATNIGYNSARLNGLGVVNNGTNISNNGYFEYGETTSLGSVTPIRYIGNSSSNSFSASLINSLKSDTTYYYRAVTTNQYGTSRGVIKSFRTRTFIPTPEEPTPSISYGETTLVTNTVTTDSNTEGSISNPSLIFLTISGDNAAITEGTRVSYVINYKNVSGENLKDVVLRVLVPEQLKFFSTSLGDYSSDTNMVIANIGNLYAQQEGSVIITTDVLKDTTLENTVVITANAVYTRNSNNSQEEVFAYSRNTINKTNNGQNLTGAAIFGTDFLPSSLTGWLLLILVILLIILGIKIAYERSKPKLVDVNNNDINKINY